MGVKQEGSVICVSGELESEQAEELRVAGLSALASGGVRVEAPEASYVDAMTLQVLLSLEIECRRRGLEWKFEVPEGGVGRWLEWSGAGELQRDGRK